MQAFLCLFWKAKLKFGGRQEEITHASIKAQLRAQPYNAAAKKANPIVEITGRMSFFQIARSSNTLIIHEQTQGLGGIRPKGSCLIDIGVDPFRSSEFSSVRV